MTSHRARVVSVLVSGCLAAGVRVGLLNAGSARATPTSPQIPTFRSDTTQVEVDVIVKDSAGKFVTDLARGDFDLMEDGAPRTIDTFYLVRRGGGGPPATGNGQRRDPIGSQPPSPSRTSAGRVFVFCFDIEHMSLAAVQRARKAAADFLTNEFQAGDVGGVVVAGAMVNGRLTSAAEELRAAVGGIKATSDARSRELDMREWPRIESLYEVSRVNVHDDQIIERLVSRAYADDRDRCIAARGEDGVRGEIVAKGRTIAAQARTSAQRTLLVLQQVIVGLAPLPGRKTVVYLSDGFLSEELAGQLQAVVGMAALSSVRVYAIDTRGLNRGSADSRIIDAGPRQAVVASPELPADVPQFDIQSDGPNSLAVDTGGLFIRNENDLARALRDIATDTSSYYVLGYRPSGPRDGRFHSIRVRVRRAGVTARARRGYLALAGNLASAAPAFEQASAASNPARPVKEVATKSTPEAPPSIAARPWGADAAFDVPTITVTSVPAPKAAGAPDGVRLRPVGRAPLDDAARLRRGSASDPAAQPMPESEMEMVRDGWAAYQRGDTKTALAVLTRPAENPAAPAWVNYVLGWAAFAESRWVVARNAWNVVRSTVPDFLPVYFDLADAYLRQAKAPEALVVLRAAEARWPASIEVLNALGVVQTSLGRLDEAVGVFQKALDLQPGDVSTRFNLGGAKELRYLASLRQPVLAHADRADAIREYRQVAESPSPLVGAARAGLRRLTPVDARALKYGAPTLVATLVPSVLHGRPVRLAWSLDGQQVYVRGIGPKTEGHVIVSVPKGSITQMPAAPDWSHAYWLWKAGQRAPWLPALAIKSETKRVTSFNTTDPGNRQRAYAPSGGQYTSNVLVFHDETIAEAASDYVLPGLTFSWSPFAMGALAFVTSRNRLAIIDSEGRKIEISGARDVLLPGWSEDGGRIAYLVGSGNNYLLHVISFTPGS